MITSADRLDALQRSGLLEKTALQRLEHLAYTACILLNADACQINALDDTRQRTVTGYPPDTAGWPEIPVELSGCQEVVLSREPLVLPDVLDHPILCALPWAEIWQGYCGVPIFFDDHVVGSVCVLSKEPRPWRSYEVTALTGIAQLVYLSLTDPESFV